MLVDENSAAGIHFGRVTAVDAKTCRIRVELPERDALVTYWLHVPQRNTHHNQHRSLPDLGAHVVVLLAANGVDGAYLGSIYSDAEPPPVVDEHQEYVRFSDGTEVSYDPATHTHRINCVGKIEILAATTVLVQAGASVTVDTPEVIVTGNATVQGKLTVQGGMQVTGGSGAAASIQGNVAVSGNVSVDGNVDATGSVMDAGGNSNHHSH